MNNINPKYEFLTKKDIEDVLNSEEFKDFFPIGEVYPECYRLPGGGYTGKGGWNLYERALKKALKEEIKKFKEERNDK